MCNSLARLSRVIQATTQAHGARNDSINGRWAPQSRALDRPHTMTYLAAIVLVLLGLYFAGRLLVRRTLGAIEETPEYKARMDLVDQSYLAEESVMEEADWFGTTGLSDDDERELPKYLRREFGELLIEEGSLKASDLKYIGAFEEPDGTFHYWTVPTSDGVPTYAYIELAQSEICTGWGNREPPGHKLAQQGGAV